MQDIYLSLPFVKQTKQYYVFNKIEKGVIIVTVYIAKTEFEKEPNKIEIKIEESK